MNTKLTLTIEQSIIEKAKKYASGKGRSLSDIIENYLKIITKEEQSEKVELTPIVKSLKGTFKEPRNFDYKSELSKRLSEKYL
jgi:replicative DNA helicase